MTTGSQSTKSHLTVEMVSACAAADATAVTPEETLQDLALPADAMKGAMAYIGQDTHTVIPSAEQLFDEAEAGFVSALAVVLVPGEWREKRRLAVVARPFGFVTRLGKSRLAIIAPARFETDFASIPPFARWLISPFGRHAEAAVIHDWLYAIGPHGDKAARRRADRVFRTALKGVGIGFLLRTIMFVSVRIGGGSAFGVSNELRFRALGTLEPINPAPVRDPYLRTVAIRPVQKASHA